VDGSSTDTSTLELLRQSIGTVLGSREDEHLMPRPLALSTMIEQMN
jgi:hypothetical protein